MSVARSAFGMSVARSALMVSAALGLFVALVLPASASGWLFWSALTISTACAGAWGWISQAAAPDTQGQPTPPPPSPPPG